MPPWSSRQHSAPSTSSSTTAHSNSSSPLHSSKRDVSLPLDHNVPLLPSQASATTKPVPGRRAHSHSISHPFPSAQSGSSSKKGERDFTRRDFLDSDDDDDDDGLTYITNLRSGSPQKPGPRWTPAEEFVTGKCMACDSTMKWPRALKVYRCTVCLTVNDLEPCLELHNFDQGPTLEASPSKVKGRLVTPLSIEHTRSIIDQCLTEYLKSQLDVYELTSSIHQPVSTGLWNDDLTQNTHAHCLDGPGQRIPALGASFSSPVDHVSVANVMQQEDRAFLAPSVLDPKGKDRRGRNRSSSDTRGLPQSHVFYDGNDRTDEDRYPTDNHGDIFRALEDHILNSFSGCGRLNNSFLTARSPHRTASEEHPPKINWEPQYIPSTLHISPAVEPDAKTLLLGDIAENSSWWMGGRTRSQEPGDLQIRGRSSGSHQTRVSSRSPRIDWAAVEEWYHLIINVGESWIEKWSIMRPLYTHDRDSPANKRGDTIELTTLEREISEARVGVQRTLLKATEGLLKRPRRPLRRPGDIRFLLILLANPLLYSSASYQSQPSMPSSSVPGETERLRPKAWKRVPEIGSNLPGRREVSDSRRKYRDPRHHIGIIKRILGLLSNLPSDCHFCLVGWFCRFSEKQFEKMVNLIGSFVTYRLTRQHGRQRGESTKPANALVPDLSGATSTIPAQLHAALSDRPPNKSFGDDGRKPIIYGEDWQIRAAARVMSLLFAANNVIALRSRDQKIVSNSGLTARQHAHSHNQMIPISSFYNTLLDYSNLVADFETWESRSSKFSFCQYPFFLSIYSKIRILEHDARRQMEVKAREAFFDSILSRKAVRLYLILKVRRDCLVEDSLRSVSEVIGSGQEDFKKGLRIEFVGEEGVDAGGLRKEWFLLLVREVFDPNHGLFIYDDDSHFCYFNPFCFESSEQFFLVGVLLGLAIYNSTILDVALPPFAFKKLLASAPSTSVSATSVSRVTYTCTLDDLAEYRPALAKGLRALLDYDGDVQETFCYDFVIQIDRYGQPVEVPLCPGGERRPVTNTNRREFVDLYVRYLLDIAVHKQFEPFKRGFFTVCGGNALSLFRPEEIELLVRGSDEHLDVASLRAVATYENWEAPSANSEPVVQWFWELFANASSQDQRKILSFITGSDRIPAMGAANLVIRVSCLGEDTDRYPIARTCFNTLGLFRYATREKLESKLWGAVVNSEGFGLR